MAEAGTGKQTPPRRSLEPVFLWTEAKLLPLVMIEGM
jgi:hypothetical protein